MPIDVIVPDADRKTYEAWRYAPAVRHDDLVFLSGVIGKGASVADEFRDAWINIGRILGEAGLGYADIVELTIYMIGLRANAAEMAKAKDEFLSAPYPASTWIGVSELIRSGARAEIRVIARVPPGGQG
ncbi:MAG: hypothetical protein IV086_09160 [Hyphomonadaceae bacterium]|nr:MAG: endoribonuclease L-PSP [Caulobacteraceae bacterium]MBT9445852.1 hypothetical protein [Hyphomonadaceae bacterium]TPW05069.1 MAG: endoribonuclease L-PSP [Alphaproteobacteria bacterium]